MRITDRIPPKAALAVVLQFFLLFRFKGVAQAQTAEPNPAQGENPTGGGELQQVVVTGYLIPRIGIADQLYFTRPFRGTHDA
jgi:hypothetical protein